MDIVIENKKSRLKQYWYVPVVAGILGAAIWVNKLTGDISYVVDENLLRVGTVEQKDFHVDIRGNGVLNPREFHWVSAEVGGHIEERFVKVGDRVEVGTPLVQVRNPELHTELKKVELDYKQIKAESVASYKTLQSQLLQLESEALSAQLTYKGNLLKLEAEEKLLAENFGIISDIDHQRSKFSVQEQKQIWEFYKKRIANMHENIEAERLAGEANIANLENNLNKAKHLVDQLTIRARSEGIVQAIDLELGQQLNAGDTVAKVASPKELIAELQVQELQVQRVEIGQEVVVDTRKNKLKGKVMRIHPSVTNGMVQVDVEFVDALTPETRIALSVEGSIRTYFIPSTLTVLRPAIAQANSTVGIYKLDSDGKQAHRISVQLGLSSVSNVQVLDGLKQGDQIIVSDTSTYSEHETILLN